MSTPAVELRSVGKRYWQLHDRPMLLRSMLPIRRPRRTERWAVRGIDLTIGPGETVGIIGHNGAGKTTLLRLLAGVSQPTEGAISIRGRIAPLISVGVGFHQEMSGQENVYVNGMLLGLTASEVAQRFDEIVAFAELEEFIDTPVKFYSSGMFMRLGFSVAVHVDPRVLLVDEVLAVGDLAFQFKCLDRMRALQDQGTTIVLVSHSVSAIRLLCPRAVVMRDGHIDFDGPSDAAIGRHFELLSLPKEEVAAGDAHGVRVLDRRLECNGAPMSTVPQHVPVTLRQRLCFERAVDSPQVMFSVVAENGVAAYQLLPRLGTPYRRYEAGEQADVEVDFVTRLAGGTYRLQTTVTSNDGNELLYQDAEGMVIFVEPRLGSVGIAELDAVARVGGTVISDHAPTMLDGNVPHTEGVHLR